MSLQLVEYEKGKRRFQFCLIDTSENDEQLAIYGLVFMTDGWCHLFEPIAIFDRDGRIVSEGQSTTSSAGREELAKYIMEVGLIKFFRKLAVHRMLPYLDVVKKYCLVLITIRTRRLIEEALRAMPQPQQGELLAQIEFMIRQKLLVMWADPSTDDLVGQDVREVERIVAKLHAECLFPAHHQWSAIIKQARMELSGEWWSGCTGGDERGAFYDAEYTTERGQRLFLNMAVWADPTQKPRLTIDFRPAADMEDYRLQAWGDKPTELAITVHPVPPRALKELVNRAKQILRAVGLPAEPFDLKADPTDQLSILEAWIQKPSTTDDADADSNQLDDDD